MKTLFQGAEATISRQGKNIIKNRVIKSYRIPQLDNKLRKQRTKKEIKLLNKAYNIINTPKVLSHTDFTISLEEIKGKRLADTLDKLKNKLSVCKQIGSSIAKLHDSAIIHGDLTTSNMLYDKNKVYFVDFGLGYESNNIEDKAVDLHVLKEALVAKHPSSSGSCFKSILQGYKSSSQSSLVLKRLQVVESRGRYKQQY